MGTGYTRNDTANNIADGNVINAADFDGEYDAIEAAFNSSTGHTHDGTAAEGAPITVLGPSQEFVATSSEVKPSTNAGLDLGTSGLKFKDLYIDGTAYIDGLGGNLLVDTTNALQFRDAQLSINSSVDGQLDIAADTTTKITSPEVIVTDDFRLQSDAAVLTFGADDDVTLTHNADVGIDAKAASGFNLRLQTGDTTVESGNAIGKILFNAPNEASGTDAVVVGAAIEALAEDTFSSTVNSTALVFKTNTSAAATERMRIKSDGDIVLKGASYDFVFDPSAHALTTSASNGDLNLTPHGTGTVVVTGDLDVDNINIDGNTISSTDTDGDINITPNGTGKVNISGGLLQNEVNLESTDAGASAGPTMDIFRNSATPAASDNIGNITFTGKDSAANTTTYASIDAKIIDATNTTEDAQLQFRTMVAGTDTPVITIEGGDVGIGVTDPTSALHVYSATTLDHITIDGTAAINRNLRFSTAGSQRWNVYTDGTAESGSDVGSDFRIARYNDSGVYVEAPFFIKRSTGNVGIGTTSPSGALHVSSGTSGDAVLIIEADTDNNNENDTPMLRLQQDGGNTITNIGIEGDSGTLFTGSLANATYMVTEGGTAIQFGTNDTARMTIESTTGHIGIGHTNPNVPLFVKANANNTDITRFTGDQDAKGLLISTFSSGGNDGGVSLTADNKLRLRTNSETAIAIDSARQVGIGTDTPSSLLELYGAAPVLRITNTTEDEAKIIISDSADGAQNMTIAYDAAGEDGIISVDTRKLMYFHGDGNVYTGSDIANTQAPYYDAGNNTQIYPQFALVGNTAGSKSDQTMAIFDFSTSGNNEPQLVLGHSTSGTYGNVATALVGGNNLGRILFNGSDGAKMANGYFIFAEAAANWTTSTSPTNVTYGIEKDDGNYATSMHSHDGYWGISDTTRWDAATLPQGLLHLYGSSPKIYIDNTEETEAAIIFRDGNAGDPDGQAAAIKFDSGSANSLNFYNNDANEKVMGIDSNGFITTPKMPAFHAYQNAAYEIDGGGDIELAVSTAAVNRGNDMAVSGNRFTAPVAGLYMFHMHVSLYDNDASGLQTQDDSAYITFKKNGVELGRNSGVMATMLNPGYLSAVGVEINAAFSAILDLAASDYVEMEIGDLSASRDYFITNVNFIGYMIG